MRQPACHEDEGHGPGGVLDPFGPDLGAGIDIRISGNRAWRQGLGVGFDGAEVLVDG